MTITSSARTARRADVAALRAALADLPGTAPAGPPPRARPATGPDCRRTRAALHDYVAGTLRPSRGRRVELHLDACDRCTRAFIDVREDSWAPRLGR
ncbi:zf-HC2 domain-containing protein [Promicromonospora thailandica]|uniref:Zinc-finger n=1 Tax=Promicromonospora thailandica TaxID=765201 RepID=A0A9X2JXH2_9MICO|nr:zf-HC2 domain-containing protein [Promicromonospora thailandica]MCP2266552.1 putative zinc-finger [Promicromonospora thailandica]BFF17374.1 hypothetical protein GCM10025730_08950 [Promicromonospora thailandica]